MNFKVEIGKCSYRVSKMVLLAMNRIGEASCYGENHQNGYLHNFNATEDPGGDRYCFGVKKVLGGTIPLCEHCRTLPYRT
jgi:hypothetical protein